MSLSDTTPKYSFPTTTGRCETRNISINVRTLEPISSSVTVGMDSVIKFSATTIIALFCYRIRIKVVNCTQNQYLKTMTRLSVNINKIATLRNTRQGNTPNVKLAAINCEEFGAEGITVHPRPDERHIRYADVSCLLYTS